MEERRGRKDTFIAVCRLRSSGGKVICEAYLLAVPKHMKHTVATAHCERVMNSGASNCVWCVVCGVCLRFR